MGSAVGSSFVGRHYAALSAAVLVAALALRLFNLGGNSLWVDEAVFANNSHGSFAHFVEKTQTSNSAPILLPWLYYLLGDTVRDAFSVRILPALFGVLAVGFTLLLPLAGIPQLAALAAAAWLCLSPIQILYSQEVREYSLSVLVAGALLLAYCRAARSNDARVRWLLCGLLFVAPLASYGLWMFTIALLAAFVAQRAYQRRLSAIELAPLALSALLSMGLSYAVTAQHQMHIRKVFYLADHYPPDGFLPTVAWAGRTLVEYFAFLAGGPRAAGIAIALLLAAAVCVAMPGRARPARVSAPALALAVLIAGSLLAALLGFYPFGGIRQQLFAAPIVIVCTTTAALWLCERFEAGARLFLPAALLAIGALCLPRLPAAYAEAEDIVSAVSRGIAPSAGSNVYVYYGAVPAVQFHFPQRGFHLGQVNRGKADRIAAEILERIQSCDFYILFSHVFPDEDRQVVVSLTRQDVVMVERKVYVGASAVRMNRCARRHAA